MESLFLAGLKTGVSLYKILQKNDPERYKLFNKIYGHVLDGLSKKYTNIEIDRLFNNDEIKEIFLGFVLSNNEVNLSKINKSIDVEKLPNLLIPELYKNLREEVKTSTLASYANQLEQIEYLESIDTAIKDLTSVLIRKINIKNFIEKYTINAIREYSRIQFFGIQLPQISNIPKENKLESLYVIPDFDFFDQIKDFIDDESFGIDQLKKFKRIVILGKPGAGKSTLTKYLVTLDLQTKNEHIPLRIKLKEYDNYCQENPMKGLIDYILDNLNNKFCTNHLNRDNIEEIFEKENFTFYFDGLDEIFSESKRAKIRDQIEAFSENFNNNHIVITSRIEGYKDTPFDTDYYDVIQINDFNHEKIDEYVEKWFNLDLSDEEIKKEYQEKFEIERYSIDEELLSNPLMLSIILILFTRGYSIPTSKLEIYKSCTETLIDRWEDHKEFNIAVPPKKNQALSHLAFWQYERKPKHEEVLKEIERFYESFEDDYTHEDARKHAVHLDEYLHKRSIYFDNNFVHKTFLEYYAAFYIYTKFEKKGKIEKRNKLIAEHISDSYWFVVLELLLSMIDEDQADNEVMEELITYHSQSKNPEIQAFFIKNFRRFKNIGKRFKEKYLQNAFEKCIQTAKETYQSEIAISNCPKQISTLHNAFDYLSNEDKNLLLNFIERDEYTAYQFEIGTFFGELSGYDDLASNYLLPLAKSNLYAYSYTFELFNQESYALFANNYHISLFAKEIDLVYSSKEDDFFVSPLHSILHRLFLFNRYEKNRYHNIQINLINILNKVEIDFHLIPFPINHIYYDSDEQNPHLFTIIQNKKLESLLLGIIYNDMKNEGVLYSKDFFDLPENYQRILITLHNNNEVLITSQKIYTLLLKSTNI